MADLAKSLTRLIGLCPDIVLEKEDILHLIDGDTNLVIHDYKVEHGLIKETAPEEVPEEDLIEEQEEHPLNCTDNSCEDPNHEDNTINED